MYQLERNRFFQLFNGEPIRLRWGGWVSDTYLLHREGWTFHAAEQHDVYSDAWCVRLAVTSPDNKMTITGLLQISHQELMNRDFFLLERFTKHGFEMQQYNATDVIRSVGMDEVKSWQAMTQIDPFAQSVATVQQIYMRDFSIFKPMEKTGDKEIYIPPENVDELFNRILQIQYPQQKEIKKGLIMPEKKPIIQAKIFSLAA